MYSQIKSFVGLAVLSLAILLLSWGRIHEVHAADVTIMPADLMPTEADSSATPPVVAKSAEEKVAEKIEDVEAGDTVTFPAGTYDDVGEILITTSGEDSTGDGPITFLGAGTGDDGTIFTGKILFNVKASNVVIRGFAFKDTETPDNVTVVADNDTGTDGDQPLKYGFPGINILQYFINKDVSGYERGTVLSPNMLNGEITVGGDTDKLARIVGFNYEPFVSSGTGDSAVIINADTGVEVTESGGSYGIANEALMSAFAKDGLGTVWVDSVVKKAACEESDNIAGVVIRNNMFMNTELAGVRAGNSPISIRKLLGTGGIINNAQLPAPSIVGTASRCQVSLDIIGNQFTDVGGNGAVLTMRDGSEVPEIGNREPAIEIVNSPKSNVRSNKISGGNWDAIVVLETPVGSATAKATINIMRNEITDTLLSGIRIHGRTLDANNENTKITISGNQITGVPQSDRYLSVNFGTWRDSGIYRPVIEDGGWKSCFGSTEELGGTGLNQPNIWKRIGAEVVRSSRNIFGSEGPPRSLLVGDTTSVALRIQSANSQGYENGNLEPTALVRFDAEECYNLGRIKVNRQEGVTISGNDLGYMAADDSSDAATARSLFIGAPKYGVVVEGADTSVTLTGNNIENAREYEVYNYDTGSPISVEGNYLGQRVRLQTGGVTGGDAGIAPTPAETTVGVIANDFMPDETAPTLSSATVDGDTLKLTYNEPLNGDSEPAASAFSVYAMASGTDEPTVKAIEDVDVPGEGSAVVTLTLEVAVTNGQVVTVNYDPPAANPIEDTAGNDADELMNQRVTNNTAAPGGDGNGDGGGGATTGGSDGGCALASSGSGGGADMGMLLLPLLLMGLVFGLDREKKRLD